MSRHKCVRLLSLVSPCCGELMFRQRPAAQANFYAITGITASFPVFSQPVIRAGWRGRKEDIEGEMEGVSVCVSERESVCFCM